MARYIACTNQLINFGDNAFYEEFIQTAYNPQFKPVSRNTTRNDLIKYFRTQRDKFALPSDIWNVCSKQDYLTVTGHYLDSDWNLQKKVLGFHPMEYAHTAVNIFNVITSVLETYSITDRIISITLDNASANTSSIALFFEKKYPATWGLFFPSTVCMSYHQFSCTVWYEVSKRSYRSHQRCPCLDLQFYSKID